jgi:hypothetical protein
MSSENGESRYNERKLPQAGQEVFAALFGATL